MLVQYLNCIISYKLLTNFAKLVKLLVPLESTAGLRPDFKARINDMLARCYSQLGEPEMQQEAYLRALSANPQDVTAKQA